jgi:glycosyltransferase involved in cell wall biosynthesis
MQNKINILFVIDGLNGGGKERQLIEILRNLDRERFFVGVVTFNENQHYTKQAAQLADYFKFRKKRPLKIEPLFSIWRCFREFRPDIVHTWDTLSSFFCFIPCKIYGVPLIDGSVRDAGLDLGILFPFKRFFLKRADLVIGNSLAGLKTYRTKGIVIYNAIDTARFIKPENSQEFNIIMTANFTDYKDQFTFLKAAVKLVQDQTVNQVFLLGDGPHKEKYIKWINEEYSHIKANFHFPGVVRNVEHYLANCKVGILCSTPEYSEGLSNSVLEYMAAGLVPIVTDLGGSAEIVTNEVNGFLIQPKDDIKIVELIHLIKDNPDLHKQILEKAKETIAEKFSMQKNLGTLTKIYSDLHKS